LVSPVSTFISNQNEIYYTAENRIGKVSQGTDSTLVLFSNLNPMGIVVTDSEDIIFSAYDCLEIFSEGKCSVFSGSSPGLEDGDLLEAKFRSPTDLTLLNNGDILVSDTGNNAIRRISWEKVTTEYLPKKPVGVVDIYESNWFVLEGGNLTLLFPGDIQPTEVTSGNWNFRGIAVDFTGIYLCRNDENIYRIPFIFEWSTGNQSNSKLKS
jgi:hypothetical protein